MIRVALLGILAFVWLTSRLDAKAVQCLNTNPCKRPPCEFLFELKIAKASLRAWNAPFLEGIEFNDGEDLGRLVQNYKDAIRSAYRKYAACPASLFYRRPPIVLVSQPACEIQGAYGPATLEQQLAVSNSCSENVAAEWEGAKQSRLNCLAFQREKEPVTVMEFRAHRRMEDEARIKSMERSLLGYLSSCKPDAKTSKQLTELGLNALKKAGGKARREWRRAQRAAARRK